MSNENIVPHGYFIDISSAGGLDRQQYNTDSTGNLYLIVYKSLDMHHGNPPSSTRCGSGKI